MSLMTLRDFVDESACGFPLHGRLPPLDQNLLFYNLAFPKAVPRNEITVGKDIQMKYRQEYTAS